MKEINKGWLMDFLQDLSDVAFHSGEKIYGRVDTRHLQETDYVSDVLVDKVSRFKLVIVIKST